MTLWQSCSFPCGGQRREKLSLQRCPSLLRLGSDGWTCLLLAPLTVLGISKGRSSSDASLAFAVLGTSTNQENYVLHYYSIFIPAFPLQEKA